MDRVAADRRAWTAAPFHPLLFAVYPVLFLYARNLDSVFLGEVLRPLAVSGGFAALCVGLFRLIFRDLTRPASALETLPSRSTAPSQSPNWLKQNSG